MPHARTAALASCGAGGGTCRGYKMGACLVRKKHIVMSGFNSYKTHPLLLHLTPYPYTHAEQSVIFKQGLKNCEGLDLFVCRVLRIRNSEMAQSKPCSVCIDIIHTSKIRNVYYSINGEEYGRYSTKTKVHESLYY